MPESKLLNGVFALLFIAPLSAQPVPALLKPTILKEKSYNEVFTINAFGDDQTFVQVQLAVTNLGIRDKNALVKILLLHEGEKPTKGNTHYEQKDWSYTEDSTPTLTVGRCSFIQRSKSVECNASLDNVNIHLIIDGQPTPLKTPHTSFGATDGIRSQTRNSKFYEYEILLPWTRSKITVTTGQTTRTITAFTMLDHARSCGMPRDVSSGWVTFRGEKGTEFLLANFRLPPEKNATVEGWIWRNSSTAPTPCSGLTIVKNPACASNGAAASYTISPDNRLFTLSSNQLLFRYSFIDELGPFLGPIVQMVIGDPVTRYYSAVATFTDKTPPIKGVLELMSIE